MNLHPDFKGGVRTLEGVHQYISLFLKPDEAANRSGWLYVAMDDKEYRTGIRTYPEEWKDTITFDRLYMDKILFGLSMIIINRNSVIDNQVEFNAWALNELEKCGDPNYFVQNFENIPGDGCLSTNHPIWQQRFPSEGELNNLRIEVKKKSLGI